MFVATPLAGVPSAGLVNVGEANGALSANSVASSPSATRLVPAEKTTAALPLLDRLTVVRVSVFTPE